MDEKLNKLLGQSAVNGREFAHNPPEKEAFVNVDVVDKINADLSPHKEDDWKDLSSDDAILIRHDVRHASSDPFCVGKSPINSESSLDRVVTCY